MAAWLGFRAEEDEAEDEACFWRYDSTWEEEEEEEEEDGGGDDDDDEGEPEGAEAAAGEEPEEQPVPSWAQGCRQAQLLDCDNCKSNDHFFIPEQRSNLSPLSQRGFQFSGRRNWNAAKDLQRYRHRYPGLIESENEEEEEMWNLSFYKNEIRFMPQGLHIETLLESWWDNYEVLEENHSYIQWLFPLREHGMNWRAKPLTCQEIQAFRKSKEVMQRFIRAYQLMLRFYGIVLVNEETGELKRAENWAERFQNLNRFSHNNLRITRILKCLGEMGYEHYQVHLVKFFLTETLVKETLPNVKRSALDYFLFTIRSKWKRRELVHYAWRHFKPRGSFVWGPHDKLLKYRPRSAKSQLHQKAEDKQEAPAEKSDDSVEKDEYQSLEEEQKAGDAADSQPKVNDEDVKEKISECVLKGGDGEEEKEASFTQQEQKDLNSEAEEVQGTAENDCTKESKKRKLDANMADAKKSGPLKSPTDIENISRNLGECAIDAEIPSSVPLLQAEEDQETLKEDNAGTKGSAVLETADAAVKRRKVDKRTSRTRTFNLAINLNINVNIRPSVSSAKLNPSVPNAEAEKENVSENDATVEVTTEKGGGDANGGAVRPPVGSRFPETGWTSPINDGLESSKDQVTARSYQYHCNSTLLASKSEVDGVEQHKKAENASEKGQAEVTGKKQVPESLEQSMASICPEEDSAEVVTQKPESSEHAAEPDKEQVAAE
ncbi:opioid growth factor receptor isoform X5 [Aquila chrysaetos chrysaetos]|uniref:opioid growth factor receptor isoform X5 n=1 Tax=Aquila chrysaetos chrysaetos TaxID=223781 RepID=UPI001B7D41E3|nr:opioid growth factor receptor isoform X5 [Aquila chrysaetos chrysaetos]